MTDYDFSKLGDKELWLRMFAVDAAVACGDDNADNDDDLLAELCVEIERRYGLEALDHVGAQGYRNDLEDNINWVNFNFENLEATARGEIPTN